MGRKRYIDENTLDMYGNNLFDRIKDYSLRLYAGDKLQYAKDNLVYLIMPYYDFNYQQQLGEMIVAKKVADEVIKKIGRAS